MYWNSDTQIVMPPEVAFQGSPRSSNELELLKHSSVLTPALLLDLCVQVNLTTHDSLLYTSAYHGPLQLG